MITYTSGGVHYVLKLFQMKGSVFPAACSVALPCAAIAVTLKYLTIYSDHFIFLRDKDSVLREGQAWAGFSFLVGFLIVFRTSQAYNRFWDGCTATHQMRAEWFDACSALVAFCRHSKAPAEKISKFKNMLVRLFSMLHASALAELEEINADLESINEVNAFHFSLIDPAAIDAQSHRVLKQSPSKVELIFSWIQFLVVDNMMSHSDNMTPPVLDIPAPILSRAFHEIANGMVAFHDATKISYIPFPFPYAQTCDCLLILHWVVVPFVTTQWVTSPWWAAIFVFIQVFIIWSLNFIAVEIENPFGRDANDLDGFYMQSEMNRHLRLLLEPSTIRTPEFVHSRLGTASETLIDNEEMSFCDIWNCIDSTPTPMSARKGGEFTRACVHEHGGEMAVTCFANEKKRPPRRISTNSKGSTDQLNILYDSERSGGILDFRDNYYSEHSDGSGHEGGNSPRTEPLSESLNVKGSWETVPNGGLAAHAAQSPEQSDSRAAASQDTAAAQPPSTALSAVTNTEQGDSNENPPVGRWRATERLMAIFQGVPAAPLPPEASRSELDNDRTVEV